MAKNLTKLLCCILVIALLAYIAICGIGGLKGVFEEGAIRQGLDLAGGTLLVYEPIADEGKDIKDEDVDKVVSIFRNRLDGAGYTEASLTKLEENGRIQVEIPLDSDSDGNDLERARDLLGDIGELMFIDSEGTIVLNGSDIKSASAQYDVVSDTKVVPEHFVQIELKANAVQKFADATEKAAGKIAEGANYIMIVLDNEIISMPYVSEKLTMKDVVITGDFDKDSAQHLASVISSGQLPFSLQEVRADSVGPTLGEKALETSLLAGGIGILLVMLFMIAFYRLPGFVTSIALVAYMSIVGIILVVAKVNLSLPGIAGIVLSIGMAVDANVIINERIKEELRLGKGTVSAVKGGFSKAFWSIFDSNITTIIASVVLWIFGVGTVKGFAITLFIGIVVSMFSALVITRILMNVIAKLGAKNPKLYGI